MIKTGNYQRALDIITERLPLPGVIGRICPHPCEKECRRAKIDEPISIRALKRFAADTADLNKIPVTPIKDTQAEVAIIGGGPAGLSCAYHLIKKGIKSLIYEALPEAGGALRLIPEYRLPKDILEREIEFIKSLGIEIKTNHPIKDIKELLNKYKAVYIATGAWKGIRLNIEGEDSEGVIEGIEFLKKISNKETVKIGKKICIIGGGNVAIDVARTALRMGAEKVKILYRRTRSEMPAFEEEIEAAEKEGVEIIYLTAPKRIITENGKIKAVECIKMRLGEPDSSGRRRPIPIEGTEHKIETDQLIVAIGQRPDRETLSRFGLELNKNGTIKVDPITYETNIKGVFAGGDAQTGPDIAIRAVNAGIEAAESIKRYLEGSDLKKGREKEEKSETFRPIPENEPRKKREPVPEISTEERKKSFKEVEIGYSEEQAKKEAERCINCGYCCECFLCVETCKAGAIDHTQKEEEVEIQVGAIVFSSGTKTFDIKKIKDFYPENPNILTSLKFERLLSASGPTMGKLVRLSDGKEPKKIAWIQCIGSRDVKTNLYCSSVCCMYAIKEAVIAKEHVEGSLDCAIFFMDMRTYGKEFEKYYERAKEEGVRFIRSKPHSVEEDPETKDLIIRYVDEDGIPKQERFDMVVLSVGLEAGAYAVETAKRFGIELEEYNFAKTNDFSPVETTKKGIYVCGSFSEPKDIPISVMEASAASAAAQELLSPERGKLIKEKEYPPEIDVSKEEPRIGVFVCNCGINIGGIIDIPSVVEYARKLPNVVYVEENLFTCAQDTQEKIKEVIKKERLNRIVVAACTPRTHEPLFQETLKACGLNKYLFEMANIRNQCSWVHSDNREKATEKAKDLIRIAVSRVRKIRPLPQPTVPVIKSALVIGGGISGMSAALSLANQGFHVSILEKEDRLGGNAANLYEDWKGNKIEAFLNKLIDEVNKNENIDVYLNSRIEEIKGFVGNFETIISQNGSKKSIKHGVIIIATGAKEYKPKEYLYGQDERILTLLDLDKAFKEESKKIRDAKSVVFIQCVGSRDSERPYCSKVCCTHSIKSALKLKEINPDTDIYILYRDIRTYGRREELYREARKKGILFIRYDLENKPKVTKEDGRISVIVRDHVIKRDIRIDADLIVLASAIVPNEENEMLSQLLRVPISEDGFFLEAHAKLRPVDFATDGIYMCGLCHYPKPIEESITQAKAAASRAATVLSKKELTVEGLVSHVNPIICRGCGKCVDACPFGAISLVEKDGKKVAEVQPALCKGCGSCAVACPTGAASVYNFEDEQIIGMVEAALGG